jgi:prevent-host-death family protein
MQTVTATEIQNNFGKYLDHAQKAPLQIMRNGRKAGVILPQEEYDILQASDDSYWVAAAHAAIERNDFMGHEESMRWLLANMDDETRAKARAALNAT